MFWVENVGEVKVNKYHQHSQITVSGLMASRLCPRMHLYGAIALLLLLFSSTAAQRPSDRFSEDNEVLRRPIDSSSEEDEVTRRPSDGSSEENKVTQSYYLLAVTSQAVGGTNETLCVTINSRRPVSITVDFVLNENSVKVLEEKFVRDFYRCVTFKVPVVTQESVALINLQIKGFKNEQEQQKSAKILIIPPSKLLFIETDKPIYKPGQTVKFRIVSLDSDFYTYNSVFPTIELRDPNSNRIGQWLNVSTSSGMVDLSFPLNSRAPNGYYIISLWKNGNEQITEQFHVKEYVLPTFEVKVEVPELITILDTNITLKVCAKYTYGKPVSGDVKAVVCHNSWNWYWYRRPPSDETAPSQNICKEYTMQTDRTGCGQQVIDLQHFEIADSRYEMTLYIQSEVIENGTGAVMTGSGSVRITNVMSQISFEDSPTTFRPGMMYKGKIKITDGNSNPLKRRQVNLTLSYDNPSQVQTLITDDNGVAQFSYDTKEWSQQWMSITAQCEDTKRPYVYNNNKHTPYNAQGYLNLQPFHSRSKSYIAIQPNYTSLSCETIANVKVDYVINNKINSRTLNIFYMVMSRGRLVYEGCVPVNVNPTSAAIKGTVSFPLKNVSKLSPHAQVVVYTLLSSGEVVADSMNFPVQPCLTNKVSLDFNSSPELPGALTSLKLNAAPGSLCSVRALDKSLLLLQPESELTIQSVFDMLPIQMLWGYPYQVYEYEPNPCWDTPVMFNRREERSIRYYPMYGKTNAYNVFRGIGVKILTNAEIRPAPKCATNSALVKPLAAGAGADTNMKEMSLSDGNRNPNPNRPVVTVRKYFPETWIWDLVPVGSSGQKVLNKKVPDSITTWQADAFCTSPVGFGIAPKAELVSFQPFFVSFTMPSSVIRGEVFTLKATVFNYLKSCITVKVSLADSKQFLAGKCKDCVYSRCLCADESFTVSWTITPLVLGKVIISVTGEATKPDKLCGRRGATVPTKGRVDTVIKTLLVKAEGTKQYKSYNELLCPSDRTAVRKMVSLTVPRVIVEGSAEASVSVIGDLMGRALQNLARLLVMPSGCGEQNMLYFTPNIYILQYLESTNQLTPEIMSTAKNYLVTGYQNELNYKHSDGSYSAFGMRDLSGNTWLTAFVMKSFGGAMRYIFIDQVFVNQAKNWLGQQQQPNGCFASVGQLIHTDMKGGVNDEVTLSAYITAAMLELNYTITDPVVNNSLTCLRNKYSQVTSTYAKALLFYTFTLAEDQTMRRSLMSALDAVAIVSGGGRHWSRTSDGSLTDSLEVEMTSYVLLALMSGPELAGFSLGYSTSIVNWLSQQQNTFGGFASTQDTVVALQALAKYSQVTYSPAGNVTVTVTSPSGLINTFTITQSNRLLYQEKPLPEVPGDYVIRARGKGCVYMQFAVSYNIPPPPQNNSAFSISASASGNCRVPKVSLEVTIDFMYNGKRPSTNMVVIEVRPLSGFKADEASVKLVDGDSSSTDGVVKLVEVVDDILVIYLDELKKGKENRLTLTITEGDHVDHNKPAVVEIYDYYEISELAVTQYTSPCPFQ